MRTLFIADNSSLLPVQPSSLGSSEDGADDLPG